MTEPDPRPPSLEELLEHAGWVRRLALSLVRDEALADDVVQQTWLSAMRSPPRDSDRVRGWLATVVRNSARTFQRKQRVRDRHEANARTSDSSPAADWVVEKTETQRLVLDAVERLAPHYRAVILLQYYDELTPAEIAVRLSAPIDTVKTQLRRAKHLLAADLTLRSGIGRSDSDGLPLASLLAPVLRLPTDGAPAAPPSDSATSNLARARARWWASLAVAGAIAVALLAWVWISSASAVIETARSTPSASGGRHAESPGGGHGGAGRAVLPLNRRQPDASAGDSDPLPPPTAPPTIERRHSAATLAFRGPLPPDLVAIRWRPLRAQPTKVLPPWRDAAAPGGIAELLATELEDSSDDPIVGFDVAADHSSFLRSPVRVSRAAESDGRRTDVVLRRGVAVRGGIAEPDQAAGAVAYAFASSTETQIEPLDSVPCDADGQFELRVPPNTELFVVTLADGYAPAFARVQSGNGAQAIEPFTLERAFEIGGSVRRSSELAEGAGGRVTVLDQWPTRLLRAGDTSIGLYGDTLARYSVTVPIGPSGEFAARGLRAGAHTVEVHLAGMAGLLPKAVASAPASGVAVDVVGESVRIFAPWLADGDRVQIDVDDAPPGATAVIAGGRTRAIVPHGAAFSVTHHRPLGPPAVVRREKGAAVSTVTLESQERVVSNSVRVRVTGAADVAGVTVELLPVDGHSRVVPVTVGAPTSEGTAAVEVTGSGPMDLLVRPWTHGEYERSFFVPTRRRVELDGTPIDVEIRPTLGGRLVVVARETDGRALIGDLTVMGAGGPVPIQLEHRDVDYLVMGPARLSRFGTTDLRDPLPNGTYSVRLDAPGRSPAVRTVTIREGRTEIVEF
ncbi:MAG: sigma-70 family RNA polymerase sigma factor [Planctomycetes bacterium]|nr:sigma-70 family RNA polymerase sigma factor [Planctomycetota bacterium]